jgi:hypothetical protein
MLGRDAQRDRAAKAVANQMSLADVQRIVVIQPE